MWQSAVVLSLELLLHTQAGDSQHYSCKRPPPTNTKWNSPAACWGVSWRSC